MAGLGQIAMNSAPIFGGVMLAVAAGQLRGPDFRALIRQDMELLDKLPPEATERRAELQRTINARIDDLIEAADRGRALRQAAMSYQGNWRDIVLLLCALLFTIVWWDGVSHSRSNWLPMFILLIVLSLVTAVYALRGVGRAAVSAMRRRDRADQS
ncbi:hypothetical protein BST27_29085 [Mycobacterium intermedium]|uniref:Uncharacterized protein n=1 Tax=Mycobacterium intermedium TaxID=28445 RepID=A0A1E3S3G4_MYCIE|nr:hypothetical protein [Mycobacterium intermedium]MCV6964449.1 hypothetical protein [Mycobacterium intermedium]ODQ96713.1 hypothetical protein BHQ20_28730 [Mycobacterium intermedium]OPE45719.1 hypothetical protein BV508_28635 [Mycobacterium intermedium]ORA93165.1 hypothetical protein BST27_29085 [Mycobacterium intermedium]